MYFDERLFFSLNCGGTDFPWNIWRHFKTKTRKRTEISVPFEEGIDAACCNLTTYNTSIPPFEIGLKKGIVDFHKNCSMIQLFDDLSTKKSLLTLNIYELTNLCTYLVRVQYFFSLRWTLRNIYMQHSDKRQKDCSCQTVGYLKLFCRQSIWKRESICAARSSNKGPPWPRARRHNVEQIPFHVSLVC